MFHIISRLSRQIRDQIRKLTIDIGFNYIQIINKYSNIIIINIEYIIYRIIAKYIYIIKQYTLFNNILIRVEPMYQYISIILHIFKIIILFVGLINRILYRAYLK